MVLMKIQSVAAADAKAQATFLAWPPAAGAKDVSLYPKAATWTMTPVAPDTYTVAAKRQPGARSILSCAMAKGLVDLFTEDDGSGRQRWRFDFVSGRRFRVSISRGLVVPAAKYLTADPKTGRVYLDVPAPGAGKSQLWTCTDVTPTPPKPPQPPVPAQPAWVAYRDFEGIAAALEERAKGTFRAAFYGDSITHLLDYYVTAVGNAQARLGGPIGAFGVPADQVENLGWRVWNRGLTTAPVHVIHIGTNNLGNSPVETIAPRALEIARYIRARQPTAHVVVLGLFWRSTLNDQADVVRYALANGVNKMGDSRVHFSDAGVNLPAAVFQDGLHPLEIGWQMVFDNLIPLLLSLK
jgi:hypothetical protein